MASVPRQRSSDGAQVGSGASGTELGKSESVQGGAQATRQSVFRAFSPLEFYETPSWRRLARVLTGNGGSYGLSGPRGSGKTWLMMKAITEANANGGLGLWFPCPSRYDSDAFLSTLSDNLANAVEGRFLRNGSLTLLLRRGQAFLLGLVAVSVTAALIIYAIRDLIAANTHSTSHEVISALPDWLWIVLGVALVLLIALYGVRFVQDRSKKGRLIRDATTLRERIHFTTGLKLSSEVGFSGGQSVATAFKRSREKALDERPATVASLIFDFRNLAERVATCMAGSLVIGIDELDKIEDADEVRELLRDIKGIFEVAGVHFLVSISDEASAALQLGTLQTGGRDEFNSSFYAVIDLPPLGAHEAYELLRTRGFGGSCRLAAALCLLAGGNQRELLRMAELCATYADSCEMPQDELTIVALLEKESFVLLTDIIRSMRDDSSSAEDFNAGYNAWIALPRDAFEPGEKIIRLGVSAIREYWTPYWSNDGWLKVQESWRRLLIRLLVSAKLLDSRARGDSPVLLDEQSKVADLRDILLMAANDAGVAKQMLESRFGEDLSSGYTR
jgi:KAP family P-loop domain